MPTEKEIGDIVRKTFEIYDSDKSGVLELDELKQMWDDAAQELGIDEEITDERIQSIVDYAHFPDTDANSLSVGDLNRIISTILKGNERKAE